MDMVAGGGGGAGGFEAGGFFDEEAKGCAGADFQGGLDEDGAGFIGVGSGWLWVGVGWAEVCRSSPGRVWIQCSGVRAARVHVTDLVVVSNSVVTLWLSLEGVSGKVTGL